MLAIWHLLSLTLLSFLLEKTSHSTVTVVYHKQCITIFGQAGFPQEHPVYDIGVFSNTPTHFLVWLSVNSRGLSQLGPLVIFPQRWFKWIWRFSLRFAGQAWLGCVYKSYNSWGLSPVWWVGDVILHCTGKMSGIINYWTKWATI